MPPPSYFFHLAVELDHPGLRSLVASPFASRSAGCSTQEEKLRTSSAAGSEQGQQEGEKEGNKEVKAKSLADDWRYDSIEMQTVTMPPATSATEPSSIPSSSPSTFTNGISTGLTTKARFEPLETTNTQELGWGVIRLYRDGEETDGLYDAPTTSTPGKKAKGGHNNAASARAHSQERTFKDEDCTTLCILAVPSYMTPSDFLGFVGEKTREAVSHFRMVRTGRGNRYMVLMKFRNGKVARTWRREWNGKQFDGMEPENLHVVFIKSITFAQPLVEAGHGDSLKDGEERFPDMRHDPFTPSVNKVLPTTGTTMRKTPSNAATASRSSKPAPPPTPSLIELPTCPVCLERMDESTGLLTILCQHVFHCSCLQKWRGSGCPVCRYTQDGPSSSNIKLSSSTYHDHSNNTDTVENECRTCHAEANLWICLICGHVGCGRYDLAHAFAHYELSGHCFAMDMDTQRVWDYGRDGYVHRILQDKSNGKFLELEPSNNFASSGPNISGSTNITDNDAGAGVDGGGQEGWQDMVPQSKLHTLTLEYTALLTSQLESQRAYFESVIARTTDKCAAATASADALSLQLSSLSTDLASLRQSHNVLKDTTIPGLERDLARERNRSEAGGKLARDMTARLRAEEGMNAGLMTRISSLNEKVEGFEKEREGWKEREEGWEAEKREWRETERDLMMFLEGREKVKQLEGEVGEEVREGFVEAGPPAEEGEGKARKRRGRGKK